MARPDTFEKLANDLLTQLDQAYTQNLKPSKKLCKMREIQFRATTRLSLLKERASANQASA